MDKAKSVNLSNKVETKTPEQAHTDEVVRAMNPKLRYAR
jgi:hypothetical protein